MRRKNRLKTGLPPRSGIGSMLRHCLKNQRSVSPRPKAPGHAFTHPVARTRSSASDDNEGEGKGREEARYKEERLRALS
ncbi:hypothetical protein ASA_1384 [Aeromonas salmonicida subsp. salmonicida A449]|uniref:Uncharacterized protein n=1 Tax=Aeromonas salmonicida (strain A449) TaxID=382245 RepID=A4SKR3_AERS4|nr:hypothetical protein ASA_1384 [Aeromonas salmonicida subsp. salmonicida A449]